MVRISQGDNTAETITGDVMIDEMHGGASGDKLNGMGGNDILFGDAGADTLDGGTGADKMTGGLDNDTYIVDNALDVVIELANGGISDEVKSKVSYTLAAAAEVEILSTTSSAGTTAINLTGNGFAQAITGNAGANIIDGKGGADTMTGLGGNDKYYVDNAGDKVVEAAGGGTDRVYASVSYVLQAGSEIETLSTTKVTGTAAIDLTGNAFAQTIIGNAGANTLNGGAGKDTMYGYGGNDKYYVDNAGDKVVEAVGGGNDRVYASVSYQLAAGTEIETLSTTKSTGTAAINLTGNEFAQTIIGNAGANVINGGAGKDTLSGGAGNDIFVFNTALNASTNVDTITDFNVANDTVHLENAIFTALTATGALASAAFRANTTGLAGDATDRIIYETDTGKLFYDADGTGATAGIHFATLQTGLALTNADFFVI